MSYDEVGDREYGELVDAIHMGFDEAVDVRTIDTHTSKSRRLPIVAAERDGWNTSVAWYAYNFHNYFTAYQFRKPLPTTLLYPIMTLFGSRHMSGHEAGCPHPDITNFIKDYWNRRPCVSFACFAGGWHMATTLRYLEAASKIDTKALFDAVMDKTKYGARDSIHGNWIEFEEMCKAVGIPGLGTYDRDVKVPTNRVIKSIRVDWFGIDTKITPCCVEVETMPGMLLPAATGYRACYVDPKDTRLASYLDDTVQLRWTPDTKYNDPRMLTFIPTWMFTYHSLEPEEYRAFWSRVNGTPYLTCGSYGAASLETRLFRFEVPNPLDAALLVLWWLSAGIPCAEAALAKKEATDVQESSEGPQPES